MPSLEDSDQNVGMMPDRSLNVATVVMKCLFKLVLWFSGFEQVLPINTYGSLTKCFTLY